MWYICTIIHQQMQSFWCWCCSNLQTSDYIFQSLEYRYLCFSCVCVCLQLNVDAITILNGQKYKRRLNLFDCSLSQNIPAAERRSLLRRPQDLLFIIYLIPAFAFCVFRGLVRRLKMCKSPKITLNIFFMWSVCVLDCSGLFQPMVSGLRAAVRALPERPFGLS